MAPAASFMQNFMGYGHEKQVHQTSMCFVRALLMSTKWPLSSNLVLSLFAKVRNAQHAEVLHAC